jgi:hypothetical protein
MTEEEVLAGVLEVAFDEGVRAGHHLLGVEQPLLIRSGLADAGLEDDGGDGGDVVRAGGGDEVGARVFVGEVDACHLERLVGQLLTRLAVDAVDQEFVADGDVLQGVEESGLVLPAAVTEESGLVLEALEGVLGCGDALGGHGERLLPLGWGGAAGRWGRGVGHGLAARHLGVDGEHGDREAGDARVPIEGRGRRRGRRGADGARRGAGRVGRRRRRWAR